MAVFAYPSEVKHIVLHVAQSPVVSAEAAQAMGVAVTIMIPTFSLNNGVAIPTLGFGVFQSSPDETAVTVETALSTGYRHIDSALPAAAGGPAHAVGPGERPKGRPGTRPTRPGSYCRSRHAPGSPGVVRAGGCLCSPRCPCRGSERRSGPAGPVGPPRDLGSTFNIRAVTASWPGPSRTWRPIATRPTRAGRRGPPRWRRAWSRTSRKRSMTGNLAHRGA
jgi:hypothetical protein